MSLVRERPNGINKKSSLGGRERIISFTQIINYLRYIGKLYNIHKKYA